ncbi:MAG: hypothetical protein V3T23_02475 [Nitrososphaerales archaeon]
MADKEWKNWTEKELADEAQTGQRGQGAVVEMMRRLKKSTTRLTWVLIVLTIILIILTAVLAAPLFFPDMFPEATRTEETKRAIPKSETESELQGK